MKHSERQLDQITERQMIFNTVYTHLFKQGRAATDGVSGKCLYRGHGGTKCAVGFLIDDRKYSDIIEGLAVNNLVELHPDVFMISDDLLPMLIRMQSLHDSASHANTKAFRAYITDGFRSIASQYNLDTAVLDEVQ